MNDIQELMEEFYDSSRWYHDRSPMQREFDEIVVSGIVSGSKIGTIVKKALRRMPTMKDFIDSKSIPELKKYYEQVRRIDLEIAIANNMRKMAGSRKRKAQQKGPG